ncbi:MAG TPA: transferrin receptor-like dimerization domain-containing protein [Thermoanaerobaculia bacterium]|nr:transferrin receptor-like dimerization domain-containing protein [Thermoanaerobaculia bacterium]
MRRPTALALLFATTLSAQTSSTPPPIFGFKDPAKEHALEKRFDGKLDRGNLRTWMKRLTARPHHLGSAYGKENAEFIASLFRSWGYDTNIERFDVLFPTPKTRVVELLAPERYTAQLQEPALSEDATSSQKDEILPPFNAYSIDGDVTADLVYVNYGVPKDYEVLEQHGIDVKGKIVIARYGGSWRGIKPKVAAEHGAVGCLIYSDPRDDGWFEGDPYPKGAYRSEQSVQRGSVADMPVYSGDPLTPGVGATADAKRLDRKEAPSLTKIPVLPISYGDALPLLRSLGGPIAPEEWRGALPIPYHLGSGPARVHLKVAFDWKLVPAYDVIARLRGTDLADQWILRGNHHDAWVHGASDPVSGLVAMMEEARAIGELAKSGWRPRRTLIFAAWDGEEPGLLGSTEWVETHLAELREHAVVYINSDSIDRGFFDAGGSHTLERFVTEVVRDVQDPERGVSVLERARAKQVVDADADKRKELRERKLFRLDALGSGSDYTPFLQHAGIAALNVGYGGEGEYGVYHSAYDSFNHYTRFGDPAFDYGVVMAKTTGRMMLRLANADALPFEATTLAATVSRYLGEIEKLEERTRDEAEAQDTLARETALSADPTKPFAAAKRKSDVPHLELAALRNATDRLQKAAAKFDASESRDDRTVMRLERALTRESGLPDRPWYRHHVYAPGLYTGYGVKTLPAVREAIELRKWSEANAQANVLAAVLDDYSRLLDASGAAKPSALYEELVAADAAAFDAFNAHDLPRLMSFFAKDVEFYHDMGGQQAYADLEQGFGSMFSRNDGIRRELVPASLQVYPMGKDGAIEVGAHRFCHIENARFDCGVFQFTQVWRKSNGRWVMTRVVSYGH